MYTDREESQNLEQIKVEKFGWQGYLLWIERQN